jgi:hypothetical protein
VLRLVPIEIRNIVIIITQITSPIIPKTLPTRVIPSPTITLNITHPPIPPEFHSTLITIPRQITPTHNPKMGISCGLYITSIRHLLFNLS